MSKNAAIAGEDSRPDLQPVYCYAVKDNGGGATFFLTNYDEAVSIASLPAKWGASDPQTFTPASVNHGSISKTEGVSEQGFEVQIRIHDAQDYSRYILFGMIPKMDVAVIKVTSGAALQAVDAEYGIDTLLVHSGIITDFLVKDFEVQVSAVPEPFLLNQQIPRWRFTRTCNHQLYGTECGADPANFDFGNAILSVDEDNRQLTISGQKVGVEGSYWRGGVLTHTSSGTKLTVFNAEHTGGNTLVSLHQWSPDLAATDAVTIKAGWDHTSFTCENKFNRLASFAGFPGVPSKNPTFHGVD
mgnify:CR=1 FL=1